MSWVSHGATAPFDAKKEYRVIVKAGHIDGKEYHVGKGPIALYPSLVTKRRLVGVFATHHNWWLATVSIASESYNAGYVRIEGFSDRPCEIQVRK